MYVRVEGLKQDSAFVREVIRPLLTTGCALQKPMRISWKLFSANEPNSD